MKFMDNYIIVILAALLIIIVLYLLVKPLHESASSFTLIGLALVFMLTGFLLEDQKLIGNFLLGIGIGLSIIDIFKSKIQSDN
ncbi:MAG TPA: hypothetical protein VHD35_15410 [Chitinophagaceae bacterium]|nr:hypothetical protein [Chitinophagaceae bacterium]